MLEDEIETEHFQILHLYLRVDNDTVSRMNERIEEDIVNASDSQEKNGRETESQRATFRLNYIQTR